MTWCERTGDANLGQWAELKSWVASHGFMVGRDCLEQTTGGIHSATSLHYSGMAVDFGDVGVDYIAIARWAVSFAQGADRLFDELFCADDGIAWSHGAPSNFHDNPAHTHVGLRAGAKLPTKRRSESMGAFSGEAIRPGESIPFRLLPPGGGAIGPIADPVYISIPLDQLGGPPASVRWAICDQSGKVIDSNDKDRNATPVPWPCATPGFLIQAHAGAFILTVENKEKAGGRIVGGPVQEWKYAEPAAAMSLSVDPAEGVAPAPAAEIVSGDESPSP